MWNRSRHAFILILSAAMLLVTGCDDSTSVDQIGEDTGEGFRDATDGDAGDGESDAPEPTLSDTLSLYNQPEEGAYKIAYNSSVDVQVLLETPEGVGIPNTTILYEVVSSLPECHAGPAPCLSASAQRAQTDPDGVASMTFASGAMASDITVRASVDGVDAIEPVVAVISVRPKESYDLRVIWEYTGARNFTVIKPRLYETQQSCAEIFLTEPPRLLGDLATGAAYQGLDAARKPDGTYESTLFPGLPTGKRFIAMGYAQTSSGGVLVYGCNDERPTVGEGVADEIVVVMQEVPILVAGTYELVSNFDLLSFLPRRATPNDPLESGDWVDMFLNFFISPGDQLWEWIMMIPALSDLIDDLGLDGFKPVVVALINSTIENALPDWVGSIFTVGADLSEALTNLQLEGELVIDGEPIACEDGSGDVCLPDSQVHLYNAATFRWGLGGNFGDKCDPAPGEDRVTCNLRTLTGDTSLDIRGNWRGRVEDGTLFIEGHGVDIPYGLIALGIIENLVLPEIFGVNSLSLLVEQLLSGLLVDWYNSSRDAGDPEITDRTCTGASQALARLFLDEGFASDLVEDIAQALCESGRNELQSLISGAAAGLSANTDDGLLFETTIACPLTDADGDLRYDMIGDAISESTRCQWTITLVRDSDDAIFSGLFHAERGVQ